MKIKLKDDVIHSAGHGPGRHMKKGETHEIEDEDVAQSLVDRKLAVEVVPPKPPAPPRTSTIPPAPPRIPETSAPGDADAGAPKNDRDKYFKQFAKATKPELEQIKAEAEKILAAEPGRGDATTVLAVATELLKKK